MSKQNQEINWKEKASLVFSFASSISLVMLSELKFTQEASGSKTHASIFWSGIGSFGISFLWLCSVLYRKNQRTNTVINFNFTSINNSDICIGPELVDLDTEEDPLSTHEGIAIHSNPSYGGAS